MPAWPTPRMLLSLLLAAALLGPGPARAARVEPGFTPLFDGRSLDGWHVTGRRAEGFTVQDGCLYSESPAGADWLATDREYTNFELRFDWQISKVGNSGVMIRNAFEVQLLAPWTPWRDDLHCTASLYGHVAPQRRPSEEGLRWRTMTILARNELIEVYVDDELCTTADLTQVPSLANASWRGPIQLQDAHAAAGEWVMFRNLRIRDLDAEPDLALANWQSDTPRRRAAATAVAPRVGGPLVAPALEAAGSPDPATARAGRGLLEALATSPDPAGVERATLAWLAGAAPASTVPSGASTGPAPEATPVASPPAAVEAALRLLARIGGQASVAALAEAAQIPALQELALAALVQNPAKGATRALTSLPPSPEVIQALIEHRDPAATGALLDWLTQTGVIGQRLILRALGAVGDAKKVFGVLTRAVADPLLAGGAIDGLVALADRLPPGARQRARYYNAAWQPTATVPQQLKIIAGWVMVEPARLELLFAALDEFDMVESAEAILLRLETDPVEQAVRARLAAGDRRPVLYRWLAAHRPAGLAPVLVEALGQGLDPAVGYQLLAPLADEPLLDPLWQAARSLEGPARVAAFDGLLTIAEARRGAEPAAAAALFGELLDAELPGRARRQAILGLGATGGPAALDRLRRLLEVDRNAAAEALFRLSARLAPEARIALLTELVRRTPPVPWRDAMLDSLAQLGVAVDLAHEHGFITHWWLRGPLPGTGDPEVEAAALAPTGPDLADWRPHHETKSQEGVMEFGELLNPTQNQTVYCYAEVTAPEALRVRLKLGSDDGYALWLNGELVGERATGRMLKVDDESHEVSLRAGVNRLVFKVMNGGSRWAGVVRLTTLDDQPLVLPQRTP